MFKVTLMYNLWNNEDDRVKIKVVQGEYDFWTRCIFSTCEVKSLNKY
jgi:hypothetical protein